MFYDGIQQPIIILYDLRGNDIKWAGKAVSPTNRNTDLILVLFGIKIV